MSECIVCLENCQDKMKCCDAPIHAGCMGAILEEGFKQCPHCRKEMYSTTQEEPLSEDTRLVRFTATPIVYEKRSSCSHCLELFGLMMVIMLSTSLVFH